MRRTTWTGSSPRLRGTGFDNVRSNPCPRFIPAPAGNRSISVMGAVRPPVHPRACGEQSRRLTDVAMTVGSSPRLRGTDVEPGTELVQCRFIPAPAGNRPAPDRPAGPRTVHPRACGEQVPLRCMRRSCVGSSPRLRGTVPGELLARLRVRFIPAPAGNRCRLRTSWAWKAVHPRACGEQARLRRPSSFSCGSSPRLRGTVNTE